MKGWYSVYAVTAFGELRCYHFRRRAAAEWFIEHSGCYKVTELIEW